MNNWRTEQEVQPDRDAEDYCDDCGDDGTRMEQDSGDVLCETCLKARAQRAEDDAVRHAEDAVEYPKERLT